MSISGTCQSNEKTPVDIYTP